MASITFTSCFLGNSINQRPNLLSKASVFHGVICQTTDYGGVLIGHSPINSFLPCECVVLVTKTTQRSRKTKAPRSLTWRWRLSFLASLLHRRWSESALRRSMVASCYANGGWSSRVENNHQPQKMRTNFPTYYSHLKRTSHSLFFFFSRRSLVLLQQWVLTLGHLLRRATACCLRIVLLFICIARSRR